jgi:hypothetical protein
MTTKLAVWRESKYIDNAGTVDSPSKLHLRTTPAVNRVSRFLKTAESSSVTADMDVHMGFWCNFRR